MPGVELLENECYGVAPAPETRAGVALIRRGVPPPEVAPGPLLVMTCRWGTIRDRMRSMSGGMALSATIILKPGIADSVTYAQ